MEKFNTTMETPLTNSCRIITACYNYDTYTNPKVAS